MNPQQDYKILKSKDHIPPGHPGKVPCPPEDWTNDIYQPMGFVPSWYLLSSWFFHKRDFESALKYTCNRKKQQIVLGPQSSEELQPRSAINKVNLTSYLIILKRVARFEGEEGMSFYSCDKWKINF